MPATVTITIRDSKNEKSTMRLNLPGALAMATVETRVAALLAALNPLLHGVIDSASYSRDMDVSLYLANPFPAPAADVEEVGRFVFRTASGKATRVSVPTWDETYTNSGSASIDLTAAEVSAFVNEIVANGWVDTNESDISAVLEAYEAFTKTRR